MKNTIIYLIRHAETSDENGIRNTNENSQIINEKEILSVHGEEQSKRLSENTELNNIDVIWSSSYTRAKATAKYIANNNNLPINLDSNLNERKLGDLKELGEFMKDKNTRDPSQEQLLDREFKTTDGESAEDTRKRMTGFFDRILKEYEGKCIAAIHRLYDDDDKLVIAPEEKIYTKQQIEALVEFQERFFEHEIIEEIKDKKEELKNNKEKEK